MTTDKKYPPHIETLVNQRFDALNHFVWFLGFLILWIGIIILFFKIMSRIDHSKYNEKDIYLAMITGGCFLFLTPGVFTSFSTYYFVGLFYPEIYLAAKTLGWL